MATLEYFPTFPEDLRVVVDRFLNEFLYFIPDWCQRIMIDWDDSDDGGTCIYARIAYEYRRATFTFCAAFFSQPFLTQREMVFHEHVHVFGLVEYSFMRETIKKLLPDDNQKTLSDVICHELEARHEAVTQDLTKAILSIIDGRAK